MSLEKIELLRLYLADPAGPSQKFDDVELQGLLDEKGDDVYSAAALGWWVKAGNVAKYYAVSLDGSTLNRDQVHRHCRWQAEYYEKLASDTIRSVRMEVTEVTESAEF